MNRRHIIYIVLLALIAPQVVVALPRDPGMFSSKHPQETLIETLTVFAANNDAVASSKLIKGRQYRFSITGTFSPNTTGTKADAGFISTNNWSSCSQNGTGIMVDATNWGSSGSGINAGRCDRFSHKYSIGHTGNDVSVGFKIADADGNRVGNSGSLKVEVYLLALVTWTFTYNQPLGVGTGDKLVVDTTPYATSTALPFPIGVPETPEVATPNVMGVKLEFTPGDSTCPRRGAAIVTVAGTPLRSNLPGCYPDFAQTFEVTSGVVILPKGEEGAKIERVDVIPVYKFEYPLPVTLKQGSRIQIDFSWNADTSKLIRVASTTGGNEVWAPFSPTETLWYQSNLDSLGGVFSITLFDPDGKFVYGTSDFIKYPGLGQIIEAIFANRIAGK